MEFFWVRDLRRGARVKRLDARLSQGEKLYTIVYWTTTTVLWALGISQYYLSWTPYQALQRGTRLFELYLDEWACYPG